MSAGRGALVLLASIAAIAIGAALFLWKRDGAVAAVSPAALEHSTEPPLADPALAQELRAALDSAVAAADGPAPAAEAPEAEAADAARTEPIRVRVRVVDVAGAPLAAVPIAAEGDSRVLGTSAPDGTLAVELAKPTEARIRSGDLAIATLVAAGEDWATIRKSKVDALNAAREHVVIAAPEVAVSGVVVDPRREPVDGALVRLERPSMFVGFPHRLDATVDADYYARTRSDGAFELRVPAAERAVLRASHEGFGDATLPVPAQSARDLVLELAPAEEEPEAVHVRGVVLFADGTPAPDAVVRLANEQTETDRRGEFSLPLTQLDDATPLVAVEKGLVPAVVPRFGEVVAQSDGHPAFVELVLGGPALSISGVVLDRDGGPCVGWQVGLRDGTEVSQFTMPASLAEDMVQASARQTTKDGSFTLAGLSARSYAIQAYDQETLLMIRSEPVPAGSRGVVLRVPADAVRPRISGTVVSRQGLPIARASVSISVYTVKKTWGQVWETGRQTTTDEAGRFELAEVPRYHVHLNVQGDEVIPSSHDLAPDGPEEGLRLEVAQRCPFRVEATAEPFPEAIGALDEDGQELSIYNFSASGSSWGNRTSLARGKSAPLSVSEDARTIVLYRDGEEVGRLPVRLTPGEVTLVRP